MTQESLKSLLKGLAALLNPHIDTSTMDDSITTLIQTTLGADTPYTPQPAVINEDADADDERSEINEHRTGSGSDVDTDEDDAHTVTATSKNDEDEDEEDVNVSVTSSREGDTHPAPNPHPRQHHSPGVPQTRSKTKNTNKLPNNPHSHHGGRRQHH